MHDPLDPPRRPGVALLEVRCMGCDALASVERRIAVPRRGFDLCESCYDEALRAAGVCVLCAALTDGAADATSGITADAAHEHAAGRLAICASCAARDAEFWGHHRNADQRRCRAEHVAAVAAREAARRDAPSGRSPCGFCGEPAREIRDAGGSGICHRCVQYAFATLCAARGTLSSLVPAPPLACSFCGEPPASAARACVEGAGVRICERCVLECAALELDARAGVAAHVVRGAGNAQCSFSGTPAVQTYAMFAGRDARICDECAWLARDIYDEMTTLEGSHFTTAPAGAGCALCGALAKPEWPSVVARNGRVVCADCVGRVEDARRRTG